MMLPLHAAIRAALADRLASIFSLTPAQQPAIVIEMPPNRALGDLAVPVAFDLARTLRKAPRVIAQTLADGMPAIPGVIRVDPASNGYLNFFLDRPALLRTWLNADDTTAASSEAGKVVVEHTAINPNKAAHIGHLRNAALGDTLVRLLRFQGRPVEVQNYIDDTGVQVADVVVGFTTIEGRDVESVRALTQDPATRFDYYCWDLYARVGDWYAGDRARCRP
jgi:arginyl-tRNA synthetase